MHAANSRNQWLERLFVEHHPWLLRGLWRRMGDLFGAEDVAAETFAQVAAQLEPEGIAEPRALLTTISRRVLYEIWRRRDLELACRQALENREGELTLSAEEQALLVESVRIVDRVLDRLTGRARRAFLLYKLDDLTYEEIGEQLGISASVVRRIVAKGLRLCLEATA